MNILYFFTFGYSLETWKNSGQLQRELKHFDKLYEKNNDIKFVLFTYGGIDDASLVERSYIKVIPIYSFLKESDNNFINFIKTLFISLKINKLNLQNPDIIIQNQLLGSWVASAFKRYFKIPLIIRTGYDMYEFSINDKKSFIKRFFLKTLTMLSLNIADIYTVTSNSDKKFLIQNFNNKYLEKLKIRPNWIEVDESIKASGINSRDPQKLFSVGRLEKQKNYSLMIESLKETNFELDIYGVGSLKDELVSLAKRLNVKVNFLGVIENKDLINKMKNYKYYISTSCFEGNPKSVLEAMAAGCLVLASDIKNHTEFLDSNNSILFNVEDNSLKDKLTSLGNEEFKIINLVESSLNTVKVFYELDNLTKKEIEDINYLIS